MVTYYKIADLILSINNPTNEKLHKELQDFQIDSTNAIPDIEIEIDVNVLFYNGRTIFKYEYCSVVEEEDSYCVVFEWQPLIYGYRLYKNSNKAVIYFKSENLEKYDTENIIFTDPNVATPSAGEFFMFAIRDSFLFHAQKHSYIAVHSASIIYKNQVCLFSALSGVGKTTHANLWKQSFKVISDFNGDICLLSVKDSTVYAYGLPWSGTSNIYTTKSLPVAGVFFLERSSNDETIKLDPVSGVLHLNARCLTPNWTRELTLRNVITSEKVIPHVFSGVLKCTPTQNAALIAKEAIDNYLLEKEDFHNDAI